MLLDERPPRKPAWASISPDGKTVVFTRNHNLYMMDDANYAKALKDPTDKDKSIVEIEITKDGEEYFGYGGRGGGGGQQIDQQQQQQDNNGNNGTAESEDGEGHGFYLHEI